MKKKYIYIIILVFLIICTGFIGAALYFFHEAVIPSHKSFLSDTKTLKKSDPLYKQKKWYLDADKQLWTMKSATGNLKLVANYIPAATQTDKTVVVAHGFMGSKDKMGAYAYLFHQLGYNVLLPDARAQGDSQGQYIGYGWPERKDYVKWINKVIDTNGQNSQIVMFGVSMGGATTMMTSGEKLPSQVKAFVEDCGYTNARTEIAYQAKELYHVPSFPLVNVVSGINKIRNGFFFGQASAVKQLHKNQRPMFFIHGAKDEFVPTSMVYQNYSATRGPKELWVVKGAKHAASLDKNPTEYQHKVAQFLSKYIK
ncbi:alpha/beta hydrolase [Paucilactobacillus nenjiangensis]|uniref:Alpha/beta hydrolase n=1 Tax=Paucilactobacillus nenjiangensis TaxID=1296540 RepID=A0A5P1X089_9LACO|nr:alpha/beta hydrolase [Paucilactobacillus nenjiangensis]